MKTLAALLAGVLLVALALAGSSRHRTVKASRPARQAGSAPHQDWRVGSPASFDNLTIFPVLAEQATTVDGFISLDEGLRTGKVIITELGADGRTHRLRSRRRVPRRLLERSPSRRRLASQHRPAPSRCGAGPQEGPHRTSCVT